MQVKKFEAATMKEALEMVKTHMGPDAIILSAKGNRNSFGLAGKGSVEVTAAVPEHQMRKKQLTESKLPEPIKKKFQASPARKQKQIIESVFEEYRQEQEYANRSRTRTPYVEIEDDEESIKPSAIGKNVKTLLKHMQETGAAPVERASSDNIHEKTMQRLQAAKQAAMESIKPTPDKHIQELKEEISRLKGAIETSRQAPSNISMHPGANWGIPYELSYVFENLTSHGIVEEYAFELVQVVQKSLSPVQTKDKALTLAWLYKYLIENTAVTADPYHGRIHLFMGNTGAGKTSSLVKFASHLVVSKKRSVAIVTADNLKIGASEQLRIFSKILNVPFAVVRSATDWDHYLNEFKNIDVILTDFPGMALRSQQELQLIRQYMPPSSVVSTIHYVQSAVYRDNDAFEIAKRYQVLGFHDVIFTSIDQACYHGILYNFQKKFSVPLHSFGTGSRMPEDFELATKERVLDLIFKLSKKD